jgi:hypothetical protein
MKELSKLMFAAAILLVLRSSCSQEPAADRCHRPWRIVDRRFRISPIKADIGTIGDRIVFVGLSVGRKATREINVTSRVKAQSQ